MYNMNTKLYYLQAFAVLLTTSFWGLTALGQPPNPVDEERVLAENISPPFFSRPQVAADSQGRFIVVWGDTSPAPESNPIVVGRRLTPGGEPMGDIFPIATASDAEQQRPSVTTLPEDNFVVAWSRETLMAPPSIMAQRFSSSGSTLGNTFQVNSQTLYGLRSETAITTLQNGDFVVVWRDNGDTGGPGYIGDDFLARRFTSDGSPQGSELNLTLGSGARNRSATIAGTPNGGFVVAWQADDYFGYYSASSRVLARRFDSAGTRLGDTLQINSDTDRSNNPESVTVSEEGHFLVVWSRGGPIGNPPPTEARGRIVNARGITQGEEIIFSDNGSSPSSTVDANGNFLVVWNDRPAPLFDDVEVVGQRWSPDGLPLSEVEILNEAFSGAQFSPIIAAGPGGNILVAWQDRLDGFATLRGRRFLTPCRADGDTLCLGAERFRIDIEWLDFAGQEGRGQVVPIPSDDSGLLWFFAADNWEMLVKVIDGCEFNNHHWVFAAATTNVQYRLTVTDTENGQTKTYFNPLGRSAPALTDTAAFATCP